MRVEHNERYRNELAGYRELQRTRPRTLGYGLEDSPVGQLAWIVQKFHEDIFLSVRSIAERLVPTVEHWSEFDRGGHFAAMEEPALFAGDVRAFFGSR